MMGIPPLAGFWGKLAIFSSALSVRIGPTALHQGFVALAIHLLMRPSRAGAVRLHLASLAYLALLFCAMAADRVT